MSEFKVGSKLKEQVVCTMQPLILCLHKYNDDITKCIPEINIFERTCSKKVNYVHDRIGLDDTRNTLYTGKKSI
ncbi:conserved Plasmodium protein, unknown function [Plasmodium sp. gorilla clade G2]|uniref:conserved Plasmodium protein, unknown function n=1 Tax=Plasmodium sp. gorilla clade G2 TaxID=880535 RepID=UPI000D20927B|nr:conserved Plasmodium protein, unknown function [Plasmodium sp. gorilla clade G2]SOV19738.1 conserved Plasmodium protein, unknown function [Plasmodium sp. gorilla clade G2]